MAEKQPGQFCCPLNCSPQLRQNAVGNCSASDAALISSVCRHRGEEPVISGNHGICNVFFGHCNLHCIYCQNHQISSSSAKSFTDYPSAIRQICELLSGGCKTLGFVSVTHQVAAALQIISDVRRQGLNPVTVYNSNGFDSVEVLQKTEGSFDIFLPDFKYADDVLALQLSGVKNYSATALNALKEMYRQKGCRLQMKDESYAGSGLIIRHLLLPGFVDNSLQVLRLIAEKLSPEVHISLMAQYYPPFHIQSHPSLNRRITEYEYERVCREMEILGMENGWLQELSSHSEYRPDFDKSHPFE